MASTPGQDVLGTVGNDVGSEQPLVLNGREPRVMLVAGVRGSGKTQTVMVMAEERAMNGTRQAVLVIDPVGGAWGGEADEGDAPLRVRRYVPGAETPSGRPLRFSLDHLSVRTLESLLQLESAQQQNALATLWRAFQTKPRTFATVEAFSRLVQEETLALGDDDRRPLYARATLDSLLRRLLLLEETGLFAQTPREVADWRDVLAPGQITVLDLSRARWTRPFTQAFVGMLVDAVLEQRLMSGDLNACAVPNTMIFLDEAQEFVPQGKGALSSEAIVRYCKCGRRVGCGMVLATQQPNALSRAVTSQVDAVLAHRLTSADDIRELTRVSPCGRHWPDQALPLRMLAPGQAYFFCADGGKPVVVRIRRRITPHGGKTFLAPFWVKESATERRSAAESEAKQASPVRPFPEREIQPPQAVADESVNRGGSAGWMMRCVRLAGAAGFLVLAAALLVALFG